MAQFFDSEAAISKRQHNLPHWHQERTWVFVTWRLADSLPKAKLDLLEEQREIWLLHHPKPWDDDTEDAYYERFSVRIDEWLDAGNGSCLLGDPANSKIVAQALHHFEGSRYALASYVIMPNHIHVLFSPEKGNPLGSIVHSWKRHSARLINSREGKTGALWQGDYWDRLIRSKHHFDWTMDYISKNPIGLRGASFIHWKAEQ